MSKFVKEGTLLSEELDLEESKALEDEKSFLENEEKNQRKSLQQQLYENRVRRAKEFHKLTEEQNSAYKVNTKDMEYYESLVKKQELQELDRQIEEEEGLQEFRNNKLKKQIQGQKSKSEEALVKIPNAKKLVLKKRPVASVDINDTKKPRIDKRTKTNDEEAQTQEEPKTEVAPNKSIAALVSGYSSSDED